MARFSANSDMSKNIQNQAAKKSTSEAMNSIIP
jgi:hypothetical protein